VPELPEVETYRRRLAEHAPGRTVRSVHVPEPMLVHNTSPQGLGRALTGHVLGEPERRGKWVLVPTDGRSSLLLHFGMTGSVRWAARDDPDHEPGDYDYVQLDLGDGILSLHMPASSAARTSPPRTTTA
jgi:formamidopyrimidine-DNA glycosylase